jgi:uncharacterized protein
MTWMTLCDGREMALHNPKSEQVSLQTIGHHLAQINRFNGAACRPYSVAEHSLLALHIARDVLQLSVPGQLAVVLHDAHEAYCGDVIYPVKELISRAYKPLEDQLAQLVAWHFDVATLMHQYAVQIERCDRIALAIEKRDLLPSHQPDGKPLSPWPILAGVTIPPGFDLLAPEHADRPWHHWREEFIVQVLRLQQQRHELIRNELRRAA